MKKVSKKKSFEFQLHKWKKPLLVSDWIIYLVVIILFSFLRPDILVITIYLLLFPYLIFTSRIKALSHLIVASFIAIVWMLFAKGNYAYNQNMLVLFGINLFALFTWSVGLLATYVLYSHWEHKLGNNPYKKFFSFIIFYWAMLIFFETMAYHVWGIVNLKTATIYSGLPICDCLHAPHWMQAAYFLIGPIYFLICEALDLENPHYK